MRDIAKKILLRVARRIYPAIDQKSTLAASLQECALIGQASGFMAQGDLNSDISGLVFSMDRALQLHALLGSYRDQVTKGPRLSLIYRVTTEAHDKSYRDVLAEFSDVILQAIKQETRDSFRGLVIDALGRVSTKNVFFLVDDNLFIEPVDLAKFAAHATSFSVPSLRMGENLSKSYTVQKSQSKPQFVGSQSQSDNSRPSSEMISWCWSGGELDWGYPLSVDGHIFQRQELLAMAETIEFDSPNTFENNLQRFIKAYQWRVGICFRKSRLINIPYNKVQTDNTNIHGEVHQDEMLQLWNEGCRIDRVSYYGLVNESAHQELPLKVVKPT